MIQIGMLSPEVSVVILFLAVGVLTVLLGEAHDARQSRRLLRRQRLCQSHR